MPKFRITRRKDKKNSNFFKYYDYYLTYFLNVYTANYCFEELEEEENYFIFKELFFNGQVAIYNNLGQPVFTPFAPSKYNIYNSPTKCTLINLRNVPFIPSSEQTINKDVVIMYAQRNKLSIIGTIQNKIEELANIDLAIQANLRAHKMPIGIIANEENKLHLDDINQAIDDGDTNIFIDVDDIESFKAITSGAPYILDKLYKQKLDVINEVLNILGINTNPHEKQERLIVDEVNSNNECVGVLENNLTYALNKACERAKKYLGITLTLKVKTSEIKESEVLEDESIESESNED